MMTLLSVYSQNSYCFSLFSLWTQLDFIKQVRYKSYRATASFIVFNIPRSVNGLRVYERFQKELQDGLKAAGTIVFSDMTKKMYFPVSISFI